MGPFNFLLADLECNNFRATNTPILFALRADVVVLEVDGEWVFLHCFRYRLAEATARAGPTAGLWL